MKTSKGVGRLGSNSSASIYEVSNFGKLLNITGLSSVIRKMGMRMAPRFLGCYNAQVRAHGLILKHSRGKKWTPRFKSKETEVHKFKQLSSICPPSYLRCFH